MDTSLFSKLNYKGSGFATLLPSNVSSQDELKIQTWAWNGYSGVNIFDDLSRTEIFNLIWEDMADPNHQSVTVLLDNDNGLVVESVIEHDFKGWRKNTHIYTTFKGSFDLDEDGLSGEWKVSIPSI